MEDNLPPIVLAATDVVDNPVDEHTRPMKKEQKQFYKEEDGRLAQLYLEGRSEGGWSYE